MGGKGDAFRFLVDNALGAVLGVAWGNTFPIYTGETQTAYVFAISNDVFGTLIMCLVTYFLVHRFSTVYVPTVAKTVDSEVDKRVLLAQAFRTEINVMIISGFSLAIGSLNATVAQDLWYMLSYQITGGDSTDGSCVTEYQLYQVLGALGLAMGICVLYGGLSIFASERKLRASNKSWATVWDLIATSFSYSIGWSFFNALSMTIGCLPGNMYYYVTTQIIRAVPLCLAAVAAYFYGLPRLEALHPVKRTEFWVSLGQDAVYTIMTLSIFDIYYVPIDKFCGSTVSNIWLYCIAAVITSVLTTVVWAGVLDTQEDEDELEPPGFTRRRTKNLVYHIGAWLVMFAWWYPLESDFKTLYEHTSYDLMAVTIISALVVTAVVAGLVTLVSVIGAGTILGTLPDWAQPQSPGSGSGGKGDGVETLASSEPRDQRPPTERTALLAESGTEGGS